LPKIRSAKTSAGPKQAGVHGAAGPSSPGLNRIKIQLDAIKRSRPINALGFMSVQPHAGSSLIVRQMARLYADCGIRTLLVEANVRELTMHGTSAQSGRSEDRGQHRHTTRQVIEPAGPGLAVTTLSACYDHNNNLVPEAVERLLSQEQSPFGLILFDFAPLENSPAILDFCGRLDGILLVCDRGKTSAAHLSDAAASLQLAGAELIGVIVNRVEAGAWQDGTS
jgi:Mrp family chromosome partitioning ATPase